MLTFPEGTETPFARAVSAEIRAVLAARRLTLRDLANGAGFKSHNYVAIRLRDEKPFTLDDVDRICEFLEEDDAATFLKRAYDSHDERLWGEALALDRAADRDKVKQGEIYLLDTNVITQQNLSRLLSAAANVDPPNARLVVLLEGVGAVGSQYAELLRDAGKFSDEDWVQLEALANGYVGKKPRDLGDGVIRWLNDKSAVGHLELSGDQAAAQRRTAAAVNKRRQEQRRAEISAFEEQEAARDEDREKPRID